MLAEQLLDRMVVIDIRAQLCRDVVHHLAFINIHSSELSMLQLPRCLSVVLILDKGEDNRRKRNQGGEGAHLFDMPSPHPSQNPSEARQEERKDNERVQVTTYVILVEPQASCLIGYAAPNN